MSAITAAAGITLDLNGPVPQPYPHGILSIPGVDRSGDEGREPRWLHGVHVDGALQALPAFWDPCSAGTFREKDEGDARPMPRFDAFGMYIAHTCSTFGMGEWEAFKQKARDVLDATAQWAVEKALARGVTLSTNVNPFFGDANVNVLGGGAVIAQTGLNWLEKAIGDSGRAGLIHAPPQVAVNWDLRLRNGVMVTMAGTTVVIGGGYSDATANGASPASGQSYAFATGPVEVRVSDVSFSEELNGTLETATNDVTYRAEKFALATWEGLPQANPDILQAAAVLVDWTP